MKIRMNVFITPEQKQALEQMAAKTGAPVAELIRRAIDAYLKRRR
jgi:predicted DNA-binding protein